MSMSRKKNWSVSEVQLNKQNACSVYWCIKFANICWILLSFAIPQQEMVTCIIYAINYFTTPPGYRAACMKCMNFLELQNTGILQTPQNIINDNSWSQIWLKNRNYILMHRVSVDCFLLGKSALTVTQKYLRENIFWLIILKQNHHEPR